MKTNSRNSIIPVIGVILILIPILYKRLYLKNMNMQSLSFFFGFITVIFFTLLYRLIVKNKNKKKN
jgi:hypothetical protein